MAVMNDPNGVTGTFDNVTVYKMFGKRYMRSKSSLTRKRVLKSRAFEKTRQYASRMAQAAKIGSVVYQALPADIKDRWLYRAITGEAASLLYAGKTETEVQAFLWDKYIMVTEVEKTAILSPSGNNVAHSTRNSNKKLWQLFCDRWEAQGLSYYYFKQAWQKRGYFNPYRFREVLESGAGSNR